MPKYDDARLDGVRLYREMPIDNGVATKSSIDFDPRHGLPEEVINMYALDLDQEGNDQYGLRWYQPENSSAQLFVRSARTMLGSLLANPKFMETQLWQAFIESMQDQIIAYIALQRGPHPNPAMRLAETREYFEAVILAAIDIVRTSFTSAESTLRPQVDLANARHESFGIRDPETAAVYPHMQRSFKYVTLLFVERYMQALTRGGGGLARLTGGSVEDLFNGMDCELGMPWSPVNRTAFLRRHGRIIDDADWVLFEEDPELRKRLSAISHDVAASALTAAAERQNVPSEQLAKTLSWQTRHRLSL
jgi:hypothetical protein